MKKASINELSRREREVLYVVYELGEASVSDVQERLPGSSYNAIRRVLDSITQKKMVSHRCKGRRFIYSPARSRAEQGALAMREVLNAFFGGSAAIGFTSVLKHQDSQLQDLELQNLQQLLKEIQDPDKTSD